MASRMPIKKIIEGGKLLLTYMRAKAILLFHYEKDSFIGGKYFNGGKYGEFTAIGWKWVVDDYKACRKMRVNHNIPWPTSARISIICPENIEFHPDDLNNFQGIGNYYQAIGEIKIGRGTYIAPNVGIITSNHTIGDLDAHDDAKPVELGENCWIGMNSVILPGVILGNNTVVGAGSIVTKSFPEGNCVIVGNPAKIIRKHELSRKNED